MAPAFMRKLPPTAPESNPNPRVRRFSCVGDLLSFARRLPVISFPNLNLVEIATARMHDYPRMLPLPQQQAQSAADDKMDNPSSRKASVRRMNSQSPA
jgi:hypothetical protein